MGELVLPDLAKVLNPAQLAAATTVDGPLLVLAGAGSGKTRVLVHRAAYILAEKKAKPWQLLAVTFTNKAAGEMRARLEALVGAEPARAAWIGTFHATSARILRIEGHRLGYPASFTIYDASDGKRLLEQVMKGMGIDTRGYGVNVNLVASEIDKAKNAGLPPKAFAERVGERDAPARRIAKAVYFKYQDALRSSGAMDFGDLVRLATELLEHHPEVHDRFGRRFRYVMVDEFQDTNEIQYRFLRALTRGHQNLMVVGDDDQSIYRWRGAEVAHILGFEDTFPTAEVVRLEENYRSTGNILAAANAVIGHNRRRHRKSLFTSGPAGGKIRLALLDDAPGEAELVAALIHQSLEDGHEPSEHAILYRMNAQSRLLEEALRKARIPYRLVGGTGFYDRAEVKDVLAYLRLVVNPSSRADFERAVGTPPRGIGAKTIERLREAGEARGLSGLSVLGLDDPTLSSAGIGPAPLKKLRTFQRLIADLSDLARDVSAEAVAADVIERTEYLAHLRAKDPASAEDRAANVEELVSSIAEHAERSNPDYGGGDLGLGIAGAKTPLEAFLDEASLASGERTEGDVDGVNLLTLHSAKGLEFPFVFIVGLEEKTFPAARAVDEGDEAAMEEERRLCYVGITRAMRALTLSAARRRVVFGKTEVKKPSRFLGELPDELVEGVGGAAPKPRDTYGFPSLEEREARAAGDPFELDALDDDDDPNPFFDAPDEPVFQVGGGSAGFSPGAKARHRSFGTGEVVAIDGAGPKAKVKVCFPSGEVRTVVAKYLDPA